jgi:hypothetical protein
MTGFVSAFGSGFDKSAVCLRQRVVKESSGKAFEKQWRTARSGAEARDFLVPVYGTAKQAAEKLP